MFRKFSCFGVVLVTILSLSFFVDLNYPSNALGQEIIKATGAGAPPAGMPLAQARMMARRAAVADAYRQLAEMVMGVKVDAQTTVRNFVTESDVIKTEVHALIKGAQILSEKELPDGSYEVTLGLGMDKVLEVMPPPAEYIPPIEVKKPKVKVERDTTEFFGLHIKRGNWDEKANGHNKEGLKYLEQELFDDAILEFKQAVSIQPEFDIAWSNLAISFTRKKLYEDAKKAYFKAIEIDSKWSDHHVNLGWLYLNIDQVNEASKEGKVALKLNPDNEWAYDLFGNIYISQGKLKEAINSYKKAISLCPKDDAYLPSYYFTLGLLYVKIGDKSEARKQFRSALKLRPNYWEAEKQLKEL